MSYPIVYDRKDVYIGSSCKRSNKKAVVKKILHNEDGEEIIKPIKMISKEISIKIQQKRQELKLSQKDLALKINERVQIIQEIEKCNYKYDRKILNKLEKVLNIKL